MSMFLYMEIINLVVRCLNVYIVMDRWKTGQEGCRSEYGVVMVSTATPVKIISFLLSSRPTGRVF